MTIQDRMAMFQSPSETKKTFQGEQRKNKFADKIAMFESALPESPRKTSISSSPGRSPQRLSVSDSDHVFKYQVKATHSDSLANKKTASDEPAAFNNGLRKTGSAFTQQASSPTSQPNSPIKQYSSGQSSPTKHDQGQYSPSKQAPTQKPVEAWQQKAQVQSTPQSNQTKCAACSKTVYVVEQIMIDDKSFHKNCLKCSHCSVVLKLGNYAALEGTYFCKPHFMQLFKLKGNYSEGFGNEPHKNQWRNKEAGGASEESSELQPSHTPQADDE